MKYVLCQPSTVKFEWQLEVFCTNLIDLGVEPSDIVLLFTKIDDESIPQRLADKYGVEIHVYSDTIQTFGYMPAIRPYLWAKYLEEDRSREIGTYLYCDSDIIFRELIDVDKLDLAPNRWYGSNCNGYLNLDYIRNCKNGQRTLIQMAKVVKMDVDFLETINLNSGGAQWVIQDPKAAYWRKVYSDSIDMYRTLNLADSDIQVWTAEMWAMLWNMMYFNIGPVVDKELDFTWATDSASKYYKTKIYHDAGVTQTDTDLFYKGKYDKGKEQEDPFNEDFSFVNRNKASWKYVAAIKKVKR